jgi:putative restriction endonuclease
MPPIDPDLTLRQAAIGRARELAQIYDDLVPLASLREGFEHAGERVSFGSFYKGIHRSTAQRGPAALTLTTSLKDPYADAFDTAGGSFTYAYRAGSLDQADNRALRAAFELQTPLAYFRALAPGQYWVVAPMFVTADDPSARMVVLEPGLPVQDMQPGGLVSGTDVRAYATREARYRLHQQRFKLDVMRAYRHRCAICSLRERELVQAAHIVPDVEATGIAAVVNGLALCAIHHLAFDRNLLGIDPGGVVHIADRLLREIDGPMLRTGLQGFHGARIVAPRRPQDRPDPHRLELRFERFARAAA